MTDKNNTKSKAFGLVIDPQKESANPYYELAQIQDTLLSHREFFVATIIHDKDLDENNYPKTTHLHAFVEMNSTYTKKQLLENFSRLLSIDPIRISVKQDNNGYLLVQYLTHKNNQEKHQYEFSSIKTNNDQLLAVKYNQTYTSPEERKERLEMDLKEATSLLEFINLQGLETANKYRATFNQVKQEQHLNLDQLGNLAEKLDNFIDWLNEHKRVLDLSLSPTDYDLNGAKSLTSDQAKERLTELALIYGEIKTRFSEFFKYQI